VDSFQTPKELLRYWRCQTKQLGQN